MSEQDVRDFLKLKTKDEIIDLYFKALEAVDYLNKGSDEIRIKKNDNSRLQM